MTPRQRRPRRSNDPQSIVRGIKTLKTIYGTKANLRKLLPGVWSTAREEHFARAIASLKNWREQSSEEILEAASRVTPRKGIGNRWWWPKSEETSMREYADRAPADAIDTDKLRQTLADMDYRTKERFVDLLIEDLPYMPPPKRLSFLRHVKRLHRRFVIACGGDPDADIALTRRGEVPMENPGSVNYSDQGRSLHQERGKWIGE